MKGCRKKIVNFDDVKPKTAEARSEEFCEVEIAVDMKLYEAKDVR